MINDLDLIQAILKGDQEAFALLYERYSARVYNVALSYTKNVEEAEEITQDVFVKLYNSPSDFRGASTFGTWIYRITVNASLNHVKKRNRFALLKKNMDASESVDFHHPGVLMENKENAAALYKVIDCLPNNQKTAFILSYIEDLPRKEVADVMETTLKAVESLLQRAKKNMRLELKKIYPNRRK